MDSSRKKVLVGKSQFFDTAQPESVMRYIQEQIAVLKSAEAQLSDGFRTSDSGEEDLAEIAVNSTSKRRFSVFDESVRFPDASKVVKEAKHYKMFD